VNSDQPIELPQDSRDVLLNRDKAGEPLKPSTSSERRKTALILSGGGARGAYEVGVVKALMEHGIIFDLVIGTSIGAINAAFIAQGDFERWERMWCGLSSENVFHPLSLRRITQLLRGQCKGILDNSPLEKLLRAELNLERIKLSRAIVGWCMTDLCTQETSLATADTMSDFDELIDTLMATSAVPLAFPPRAVAGTGLYIDGGLVRNTPMKFALELGIQEIYAVLLHSNSPETLPTHFMDYFERVMDVMFDSSARNAIAFAHFYNGVLSRSSAKCGSETALRLHVLKPRKAMRTSLLRFEPKQTVQLIADGYDDTVHHLVNNDCAQCQGAFEEVAEARWF
jgi:predicted acylesterase/phospholipase RssA